MTPAISGSSESCVAATTFKLAPEAGGYWTATSIPILSAIGMIRSSTYAWEVGDSLTASEAFVFPMVSSTDMLESAANDTGPVK